MIFVNDPGDWAHVSPPFDHAAWHGWTPTDLIFPFFLFIVGTAAALSLARRAAAGADRGALAGHALVRGAVIVLVGWAMSAFPYTLERLRHIRIPGVLPRIGVVYALGALVVLAAGSRRRLVIPAVIALLLAVHTFLLLGLGYDLTPKGNVARAVDMAVLKNHLWKGGDWDPEGIVSTLTALATMLTGVLAGELLIAVPERRRREAALLAAGVLGAGAGLLGSRFLPINKNLWTASYVLLSSGLACVALAACLVATDRPGKERRFGFFQTFGKNPLLAFVLSGMTARVLGFVKVPVEGGSVSLHQALYAAGFSFIDDLTLRSHAWALAMVLFWYLVLRLFERLGWFWKV
jgi:predicted acyltransferase